MATRFHLPRALWAFLLALVLGGGGWLAASYGGTSSQARVPGTTSNDATLDQVGAAPTEVYECYSIAGGQDPKKAALLTTKNFGHDVVGVRGANLMCESALKLTQFVPGTPPPQPPDLAKTKVLECFKIEKGIDPNDPALLQTANFGADKVNIGRASTMCENALKRDPSGKIIGQQATAPGLIDIWECFQLQNAISPNKVMYFTNNNFGLHRASVRAGDMMCETAIKQTSAAGEVFGDQVAPEVWQCFRLADAQPVNQPRDLLTRNFPDLSANDNDPFDAVRVQRPAYMCEHAVKEHIIEYPFDPTGNPAGADVNSNGD